MSHESQDQLSQRLAAAKTQVTVGARYRHYKNLTYNVLEVVLLEENNEPCVVYQAEYGDKLIWVRRLSSWLEHVTVDGKHVKRFTVIED
jgi:hypothetical protein